MKLRCPRQHRIGETCGAKLVHEESVERPSGPCRKCEEIETKKRRWRKENENVQRWSREGDKFKALIEKAQREKQTLEEQIQKLARERVSVIYGLQIDPVARGSTMIDFGGNGASASNRLPGNTAPLSASRHAPAMHNGYSMGQGYLNAGSQLSRHHGR